jgi:branched-chain amino acid transport system substrate-binding protein
VGRILRSSIALVLIAWSAAAEPVPILVPPDQTPGPTEAPRNEGLPAIGVLLPISGKFQSFGESCLRGIRLALGAVGDRTPLVRLVVIDSRGDAQGAAQGYQRLVADPGVVVVLGPMLSPEVDAVRPLAQASALATLDFSQRAVPVGGPLFRFSLTKEEQAAVLAQYAVGDLGLRRWATFHPDDAYGREIAAEFRSAVETLGGRIVAEIDYDPAKNDLQTEARRLQSKVGAGENQPARIDGVFLPDSAARVALLVSYLTFIDVRGVQLLGASGWDKPQELLAAGPPIDGAVFVDGFFVYSFRPEVRSFVDAFRDAYHGDPGTLEAYGYDAAMLTLDLIAGGGMTRPRMLAAFHHSFSRRGATGDTLITADGRIEKSLFLLKVDGGTIHEVDTTAAAAAFREPPRPRSAPIRQPEWDSRSMEGRSGR